MPSFCRTLPRQTSGGSNVFEPIDPCDLKLLAKVVQIYMWSPGVFKDNQRRNANFLYSDFIGFDVDNKPSDEFYSLEQAVNDWQDSECIIATTRNHLKTKTTNSEILPAAPRFRIITRWEQRITDPNVFTHTVESFLKANPQYDSICKDPARMFYPCNEVVFANFDGYRQPVKELPKREIHPVDEAIRQYILKPHVIEPHVMNFIKKGAVFGGGRNISVYIATLSMLRANYDPQKVLDLLQKSPFDRRDFTNDELHRAFNNGLLTFANEKNG